MCSSWTMQVDMRPELKTQAFLSGSALVSAAPRSSAASRYVVFTICRSFKRTTAIFFFSTPQNRMMLFLTHRPSIQTQKLVPCKNHAVCLFAPGLPGRPFRAAPESPAVCMARFRGPQSAPPRLGEEEQLSLMRCVVRRNKKADFFLFCGAASIHREKFVA